MVVIAGALLGLIALLATLQYKWLGQITGAERERMKATLNARATAYAQDVDRELTRAYLLFQLEAMQPEQGAAAGVAARYDRWQASARVEVDSSRPWSFRSRALRPAATSWCAISAESPGTSFTRILRSTSSGGKSKLIAMKRCLVDGFKSLRTVW